MTKMQSNRTSRIRQLHSFRTTDCGSHRVGHLQFSRSTRKTPFHTRQAADSAQHQARTTPGKTKKMQKPFDSLSCAWVAWATGSPTPTELLSLPRHSARLAVQRSPGQRPDVHARGSISWSIRSWCGRRGAALLKEPSQDWNSRAPPQSRAARIRCRRNTTGCRRFARQQNEQDPLQPK